MIALADDGRPFLVAAPVAATGPPSAPTVWGLADPKSSDRIRAWLAGITAGSGAVERPSAR
jgi:hypothetical protein